jgi:tRNA pseudouridine38-40 synthase
MPSYLLIIEYDGSGFSGWQKQPGLRTVQGVLEKAAKQILGGKVSCTAAGRTDAGVHARGQAVSVSTPKNFETGKLLLALNTHLPPDISVGKVKRVKEGFDARRDAVGKIYSYRAWDHRHRSVWADKTSWHVRQQLDMKAMKKAAGYLEGRHDFSAFAASGGSQENKVARLKRVRIFRKDGCAVIELTGDRFLYRMARNIAGTLVDAGRKRITPEKAGEILKSGDRRQAGETAPAKGLFLEKVRFGKKS